MNFGSWIAMKSRLAFLKYLAMCRSLPFTPFTLKEHILIGEADTPLLNAITLPGCWTEAELPLMVALEAVLLILAEPVLVFVIVIEFVNVLVVAFLI